MNKSLTKNIHYGHLIEDEEKMSPRKLHCDKQG